MRPRRSVPAVLLALGVVACSGEAPVEVAPVPPPPPPVSPATSDEVGVREPLPGVHTVGTGKIYAIATEEILETDELFWPEEQVSDELIAGPLLALKVLLLGPWSGAASMPPVEDVFTADARVAAPEPALVGERVVADGVRRFEWDLQEHEVLDPMAYAARLAEHHDAARRVRWVMAKPARVELEGDDTARVKLKLRWNRELADGGLRHDKGVFDATWKRTEDGWRCAELKPTVDAYTLISESPHLVDATLESFAGTSLDPRLPTRRSGSRRGLALSDIDDDGDPDLLTTIPLRLLVNRGDGTFDDASSRLLGKDELWNAKSFHHGALIADFDRDGDVDLMLSGRHTKCLLFRQDESGDFHPSFVEASHEIEDPASLSAHDVDGDGLLDVFVSGYGPFVHPGPNDPTAATNGDPNQMLRGLPNGEFEDVTRAWGIAAHANRWSFIGAFGDVDGDGDHDLYVANDFGPNVLYRRLGGPGVVFAAEMEDPKEIDSGFSMSATFGDLDGDLDLDLYVSNMASTAANRVRRQSGDPREEKLGLDMNDVRKRMSRGNTVYLNDGEVLAEAGDAHGAKAASWAWGTGVYDYDCDGDLDIHCVNGFWSQGADDGRDL